MATAKMLTYTWGLGLPGGIGGLLDLYQGAVHFSYLYDGKGNVAGLLDPNGNIAATYQYDPFGMPRVPANSIQQPFQFSTKPYDERTGLSYYGYRYYISSLGRWLTREPLGEDDGINLYEFVWSNPANLIDPDGLRVTAQLPPGTTDIDIPFIPTRGAGLAKISKNAGQTIRNILKRKRACIKNAPLPEGSPSWEDLLDKTWEEVENMLKNSEAWKTIRKLLTKQEYNK